MWSRRRATQQLSLLHVDGHPWIDSSDLVFLHFLHYPWQQQVHNLNLFSNFCGRKSFFFCSLLQISAYSGQSIEKHPPVGGRLLRLVKRIECICSSASSSSSSSSWSNRRIIRAALVVLSMWTLQKKILTSKFSYLLFSNPTHKTKTGTANRWESTNSNLPRPIIMNGQSETGSSSQSDHIYYTLL